MRLGAERTHKTRALRVGNAFYNDRPAGLAQFVQHRLRRSDDGLTGRTGLLVLTAVRFADTRFTGRLVRRLAARPLRVALVARMVFTLTGLPFAAGGLVFLSLLPYFLR